MAAADINGDYPELLPRRQSLGYQINHLARLFEQQLRIRIASYGVVPGQFAQLLALYEEEPLTQRELCARVRIEQSTMASTLQRMERDGLIQRTADPTDRRRAQISLTPLSWALQGKLIDAARQVNALATSGISEDSVTAFMSGAGRMIENFESSDRQR
ncbi:MAG TPA: MarR family winged helix-turn-helix transcriptional regulator [Trebonia sp.]|nr:MarR family winged helix-turn-helix transcriptional regulator [Trebonia sp.]